MQPRHLGPNPGLFGSWQVGRDGHSSVEDARATMELYKVIEAEWEKHLALSRQQE